MAQSARRHRIDQPVLAGGQSRIGHGVGPSLTQGADPGRFFAAGMEAFGAAVQAAGGRSEFDFTVASTRFRLQFAGEALRARVIPALQHLEVAQPGPADFTIMVWDTASTGIPMPPPAWGPYSYGARGEILGFNTDLFRTEFQLDPGCLSMAHLAAGMGMFWIRDSEAWPWWMDAAPLRTLVAWRLSSEHVQFVHGAGVGIDGHGILLAGRGGSGKSTTALRCLLEGFDFVGDDYVVATDGNTFSMHSVYGSAKLGEAALSGFVPGLRPFAKSPPPGDPAGKDVLMVRDFAAERLASGLAIEAVLVLRVAEGVETRLARTSAGEALVALAPTTIFQLAGAGPATLRFMSRLVQTIPSFELPLGRDGAATRIIRELLEGL